MTGVAPAGFFGAKEQPVLLADGGWPDGIFDQVVVDLDFAMAMAAPEVLVSFKTVLIVACRSEIDFGLISISSPSVL
jgi:hypothetical protein